MGRVNRRGVGLKVVWCAVGVLMGLGRVHAFSDTVGRGGVGTGDTVSSGYSWYSAWLTRVGWTRVRDSVWRVRRGMPMSLPYDPFGFPLRLLAQPDTVLFPLADVPVWWGVSLFPGAARLPDVSESRSVLELAFLLPGVESIGFTHLQRVDTFAKVGGGVSVGGGENGWAGTVQVRAAWAGLQVCGGRWVVQALGGQGAWQWTLWGGAERGVGVPVGAWRRHLPYQLGQESGRSGRVIVGRHIGGGHSLWGMVHAEGWRLAFRDSLRDTTVADSVEWFRVGFRAGWTSRWLTVALMGLRSVGDEVWLGVHLRGRYGFGSGQGGFAWFVQGWRRVSGGVPTGRMGVRVWWASFPWLGQLEVRGVRGMVVGRWRFPSQRLYEHMFWRLGVGWRRMVDMGLEWWWLRRVGVPVGFYGWRIRGGVRWRAGRNSRWGVRAGGWWSVPTGFQQGLSDVVRFGVWYRVRTNLHISWTGVLIGGRSDTLVLTWWTFPYLAGVGTVKAVEDYVVRVVSGRAGYWGRYDVVSVVQVLWRMGNAYLYGLWVAPEQVFVSGLRSGWGSSLLPVYPVVFVGLRWLFVN